MKIRRLQVIVEPPVIPVVSSLTPAIVTVTVITDNNRKYTMSQQFTEDHFEPLFENLINRAVRAIKEEICQQNKSQT